MLTPFTGKSVKNAVSEFIAAVHARAAGSLSCWTIFGLFLVASTTPSPLYGVYAARFHFSSLTITTVFAVYALPLLTTLLVTVRCLT